MKLIKLAKSLTGRTFHQMQTAFRLDASGQVIVMTLTNAAPPTCAGRGGCFSVGELITSALRSCRRPFIKPTLFGSVGFCFSRYRLRPLQGD
ncbi:hypothetical protein [Burkholderia ambifaria]|uniref:hypothetical protein n=1 Tax=Burkholderia ambifaria TaxID=152480 RepID=UPI001FC8E2FD|nr:hypothetical protein [Burkholderia ambifaria]